MTAHKEQDESIVLIRLILDLGLNAAPRRQLVEFHGRRGFPAAASQLAAQVVRHAPRSDLNQPRAGIAGKAFPRPLIGSRDQRLLNGILGVGEVAETADDRAQHLRSEFAQQILGTAVPRARYH